LFIEKHISPFSYFILVEGLMEKFEQTNLMFFLWSVIFFLLVCLIYLKIMD